MVKIFSCEGTNQTHSDSITKKCAQILFIVFMHMLCCHNKRCSVTVNQ